MLAQSTVTLNRMATVPSQCPVIARAIVVYIFLLVVLPAHAAAVDGGQGRATMLSLPACAIDGAFRVLNTA